MTGAPRFRIHRSNRTEQLAGALGDVLATPVGGPFDPEWVVVQGRGMGIWLSQQLARRHGVWANGQFLYPRNFVQRLFSAVLGEAVEAAKGYGRDQLLWTVLALLDETRDDPRFARLARYASHDPDGTKRYRLAARVADAFDQYLTYRPDMIRRWETAEPDQVGLQPEQRWQPVLWRRVVERIGKPHLPALERAFLTKMAAASVSGLPARVSVFAIASLPPLYVRAIAALARQAEVHLFLLSPCHEYWGELSTARQQERALRQGRSLEELHLEQGNRLLATLGGLGADFNRVLAAELDALEIGEQEVAAYHEPDTRRWLGRVQADILHLRPGAWPAEAPRGKRRRKTEPDRSIAVHACHGPMREVEVLHDQLLDVLATTDTRPQDIVVMMSDVETYAPLVESVFRKEPGDARFIPFQISDRSLRREGPVIDALLRLLGMVGGRVTASELLDFVLLEPVTEALQIAPAEVDTLVRWVIDSGIRWGIDGTHRAAHAQPAVEQNTWRFGLRRLLLGYAMAGDDRETFEGVLPFDDVEGKQAELLGKLALLAERVFGWLQRFETPRSMRSWQEEVLGLLDELGGREAGAAWEAQQVRAALAALREAADEARVETPIEVAVLRELLGEQIDGSHPARGFASAGVTFCAMVPMRSVPFRVLCVLGMGERDYPRARRPADFDLIAHPPSGEGRRPGDRSRRDDDLYLFLEAILCARERLILTYTGQGIRDNKERPPSMVVSELVMQLLHSHEPSGTLPGDEDSRVQATLPDLFTRHPLQPFSPRYFDGKDPALFSYDPRSLEGARGLLAGDKLAPPPLFSAPLAPAEQDEASVLALGELLRFFANPTGYLLNRRLLINLHEAGRDVPDREALTLDPLDRYRVGDRLLSLHLGGVDDTHALPLLRAAGFLPAGTPGTCAFEDVLPDVRALAAEIRRHQRGLPLETARVALTLPSGVGLAGELPDRYEGGLLRYQFSRVSGKHVLDLWIRHLVACARGDRPVSTVLGRPATGGGTRVCRLAPVDEPLAHLDALVRLYRRGQHEPLLLFPPASMAYAEKLRGGGDFDKKREAAMQAARRAFEDTRARDPHLQRVFPGTEALEEGYRPAGVEAPGFTALALAVFGPLLDHLEEA